MPKAFSDMTNAEALSLYLRWRETAKELERELPKLELELYQRGILNKLVVMKG